MVLTTAPSTPKLAGLKEIFDPDIILGFGLWNVLDYVLGELAIRYFTPLTGRPFGGIPALDVFGWDDIIVLIIEFIGAIFLKGRLQKIFFFAFWLNVFFKIGRIIQRSGISHL